MNRIAITTVLAIALAWSPSCCCAQSVFGGRGIGSAGAESSMPNLFPSYQATPPTKPKSKNPFAGWFSRKPAPAKEGFQFPKLSLPKWEMPSLTPSAPGEGMFSGLSKPAWMERDPNEPSMFEKMSQKSKAWADQTGDWFRGVTSPREKPASWDSIRRDMEEIQQQKDAQADSRRTIRPNIRSARSNGDPRLRY